MLAEDLGLGLEHMLELPDLVLVCGAGGAALDTIRQLTPPDVAITTMPPIRQGVHRSSASA